jgi:hypothetical protein
MTSTQFLKFLFSRNLIKLLSQIWVIFELVSYAQKYLKFEITNIDSPYLSATINTGSHILRSQNSITLEEWQPCI